MQYLIVFALCFLSCAKLNFQGAFAKKSVTNPADALKFNIFIFVFSALLFSGYIFGCSTEVWIYGVFAAVFAVGYQITYTSALSSGNVSLTVLIMNFSMVLSVLASYFIFGDTITTMRILGTMIAIASFVVCCKTDVCDNLNKKWLLFAILSMFFATGGNLVNKAFGASVYKAENFAYISSMYILSAVFSIIIYPVMTRKEKPTFKINFSMFKFAFLAGICLATYQLTYTYALSTIDGTFLFPAQTGGQIIMSTLSGVLIFKDKFTKRQITGLVLGIIALVIMNF